MSALLTGCDVDAETFAGVVPPARKIDSGGIVRGTGSHVRPM
ncbi:hypothetical protein SAMN06265355_109242 [Actinomadura mexicana]|uniref:Uncharacterized protein n=1 Tax=Actinomadura mexicana TaxID=134959 RepID=A0A239AXR1_9ACTN|nr:hypothetical protein SAMN06265355_109242 [Actinomadura mexicana]